ncbi:MAG TPA: hypothetical protein VFK57_17580 [Vicinamibacterales bacterium]|nr:hypothetical protein [Vicinamibacterales bacterium]
MLPGLAIWLSFGSLAVTAAVDGRRIGLLPPLWSLGISLAASVAVVHGARRLGRSTHVASWALLILLPWLPVPVPDVFLIWTGPIVVLVWMAIAGCALPPWLRAGKPRAFEFLLDARVAPRMACALAFVASLLIHARQQLPPTGDEPHYLLIAHSVVVDRDLEVSNNYERGDYLAYYAGLLRPHYAAPARDGALYSLHGQGLPVLIAPTLAIGGYRAVVWWIAAIGAVGTLFVWKAAHALTANVASAWFAWAASALTAPVVLHSTLVYPDSVAGTVLAAGVLAMLTAASLSAVGAAALGAGIGLLPWLHIRLAPAAVILLAAVAARIVGAPGGWRRWWRVLLALALPIGVSAAAWLLFFGRLYGTLDPLAPFHARAPLRFDLVLDGLAGLAADQEFGLIPNAPVHALWIAGAAALWRVNRRLLVELAALTVPYVVAVAAFPDWFGASTPARYLTPLVFPMSVTVASLWARQDGFGRSLSAALLVVSVLIAVAFGFGAQGTLAYNAALGRSALLDWLAPLVNLPGGFPSYFRAIPAEGPVRGTVVKELLVPAAIWAGIWILAWRGSRRIARWWTPAGFGRPALAAGSVVLVVSAAVAGTWAFAQAPHVLATRSQLALIARESPRATPRGVQFLPLRVFAAEDVLPRMEVSTSLLETPRPGVLLALDEVPPGDYRLRLRFASEPRGEIRLAIGESGMPLESWQAAAAENTYSFHLPIRASRLVVTGDAAAAGSIRTVAAVPIRHLADTWAGATRARAAARYGRVAIYAIDNRIAVEPDGFWVLGGRQPDVVMTTDGSRSDLRLEVSNVSVRNRVRVSHGSWSETRDLAPDERWIVTVPLANADSTTVVNFRVEQGATIAGRSLGCRIRIVD